MTKTIESKQIGLEVGQIFAKYLFGSEDLHYGYWTDGLEPCVQNFPAAQARHSELIFEHIPSDVRTILDVGGGSGALARDLQQRGYEVECVIPSAFLAEKCREKLRPGTPVHESTLQSLELERTFDLVLFSESFQYVRPISEALDKCESLVRPGGHLLICDCFRKDQPGRAPIKGGIRWNQFREELRERPLRQVVDVDMTPGIARSFDVFADMLQNLALPVSHVVSDYVSSNYPLTAKILKWKFKSRLRKVEQRYFSGEISAETFSHWKSYRLMVFRLETADSGASA